MQQTIPPSALSAALMPANRALCLVGFFLAYTVLDRLTYVYPGASGVVPFNPEAALAIVLLMGLGAKALPVVFAATLVGEIVVQQVARPASIALLCAAIITLGYAATARLLVTRLCIGVELGTRREVVRLMMSTLICMLLCGLTYIAVLRGSGIGEWRLYPQGVRRFFTGYGAGIMVALPLVLMALSAARREQARIFVVSREAWMQIVVICACVIWVFFLDVRPSHFNVYLLFVPLVWAATRFGLVGASIAMGLIQACMYGVLIFTDYRPQSMFELQMLMLVLAGTGLLLGVSIDEQRRASEEMRDSLRLAAAGEMAAALTHELNQPLTALSGYASAARLLAATPTSQRLSDTLDKINTEASRAASVIRRLRDFFSSGATRLERVALPAFIQKAIGALQNRADGARVTLSLHDVAEPVEVWVDTVQIEVVLRNLLMNAIESASANSAGDRRVQVTISRPRASEWMVSVDDSGGGVREADAERLFKSFESSKSTGMGMGLAISRAIVNAHGGRIWAEPGTSGRFCFTLPADTLPHQGKE